MEHIKGNAIVGQSGGPTAAINATLSGVIRGALADENIGTIYGAYNGVEGMLNGTYCNLTEFFADESKLKTLCERFALPMNERITSFSKGTQKRAQICLGLALNPRVLLCDETFDGLDPVMRDSFKRVLSQETVDRGLITVLAGHNQQEMEDICDSVGFLHEGRLVCSGDLDTLLGDVHRVQLIPAGEVSDEAFGAFHPLRLQRQGRLCMMTLRGDRQELERELSALSPLFMEFLPLSLEEVFILEMEDRGYAQQ